jgi:hypothetical protein
MPKKSEVTRKPIKESITRFDGSGDTENAEEMDLAEFATKYRKKVQGHLWQTADKITVGDLMKITELERDTQKHLESKRPREIRVVWINNGNKSTT